MEEDGKRKEVREERFFPLLGDEGEVERRGGRNLEGV
jgi:hypothetical protein